MAREKMIPEEVLRVLEAGRCEGDRFFLGPEDLERKLYVATNKVLEALGGKWNRKALAHIFADPCEERLDAAIATGSYSCPKDLGYFPTPEGLALELAEELPLDWPGRVLEPSGGDGALVRALLARGLEEDRLDIVELEPRRAAALAEAFPAARVQEGDFEECELDPPYALILMNPPFAKGADIRHVTIALELLEEGGALRAIVSAGVLYREQKAWVAFRELIESLGGEIEALPEGSFLSSGTAVRTAVVRVGAL